MAIAVRMPKLGLSMVEGTVAKWLKDPGDEVEAGEPIVVVETNKITVELEAEETGILHTVLVADGDVAPISAAIGVLASPGEEVDLTEFTADVVVPSAAMPGGFDPSTTRLGREGRGAFGSPSATSAVAPKPGTEREDGGAAAAHGDGERVKASPLARRIAAEHDVPLSQIRGHGPGGRIEKADVEQYLEQGASAPAQAPAPAAPQRGGAGDPYPAPIYELMRKAPDRQDLRGTMRNVIARNMERSRRLAAHATMSLMADVSELIELRQELIAKLEPEGVRPTYTDILVKALGRALSQNPMMRSIIVGDELIQLNDIDISIAVQLREAGLVVPVIRDCDSKSLAEITRERIRLMDQARESRLAPEDSVNGCFTLTNMGALYDLDHGTPILNLPQSAILGVSSINDRVIAVAGEAVVRPTMNLFMSIDHRVIDGEPAVRFLNQVRDLVQSPRSSFVAY